MAKRPAKFTPEYFRQQGAKGGRLAAETSTKAERVARATKASQAAAKARTAKAKKADS